jgi:hypothetical protein
VQLVDDALLSVSTDMPMCSSIASGGCDRWMRRLVVAISHIKKILLASYLYQPVSMERYNRKLRGSRKVLAGFYS